MKINSEGLALLKSFEGCRLEAYKLKGERNYTIGYGHSDTTIKADTVITQAKADEYLRKDLEKFEKHVTNYAVRKFPELNENQFSSLVSYCYNRGLGGLKELLNNSSNYVNLGQNIVTFWGKNKNYEKALKSRREKEKRLYFMECVKNASSEIVNINLPIPKPTLKRGSKGVQVEYLQKCLCLNNPEIKLKIDGQFGEKTYKALRLFQEANYLQIDGIYGKHSYNKMRQLFGR